jgi:hypothetical protein
VPKRDSVSVLQRFFTASVSRSPPLEDGSGISRGNRFTARGLAQLLQLFESHATLLRRGDGARFKTGTFSGVAPWRVMRTLPGTGECAS